MNEYKQYKVGNLYQNKNSTICLLRAILKVEKTFKANVIMFFPNGKCANHTGSYIDLFDLSLLEANGENL